VEGEKERFLGGLERVWRSRRGRRGKADRRLWGKKGVEESPRNLKHSNE
jgi:hypothetical protein